MRTRGDLRSWKCFEPYAPGGRRGEGNTRGTGPGLDDKALLTRAVQGAKACCQRSLRHSRPPVSAVMGSSKAVHVKANSDDLQGTRVTTVFSHRSGCRSDRRRSPQPEPRPLHGVVGLAQRAEDAVGDRAQLGPLAVELVGQLEFVHRCHAVRVRARGWSIPVTPGDTRMEHPLLRGPTDRRAPFGRSGAHPAAALSNSSRGERELAPDLSGSGRAGV
jgi:hypothetical protein